MKLELRNDIFEKTKTEYERQGYVASECYISMLRVSVMALLTAGPIALLCFVIYVFTFPNFTYDASSTRSVGFLVLFSGFIILHEFLHGVTWGLFCKDKRSISYGVIWKHLTPYCTCAEPLSFSRYLLGALMPLLVLGIGLFLISLIIQSELLLYLSCLNIVCAGGDTTIAIMMFKHRKSIFLDHPTKIGYVAFNK